MLVRNSVASTAGAIALLVALATAAEAQFTPVASTAFTQLDAGQTTGLSQNILLLENQPGPSNLTIELDRGSFDFSAIVPGGVIGTVIVTVDFPGQPPLPAVFGTVEGDIVGLGVSGGVLAGATVVTSVSPALLPVFTFLGIPDPTGMTALTHEFTNLAADGGATIETIDSGVLPTSTASLDLDVPIDFILPALYVHSPVGGTLEVTTTIESQTGTMAVSSESFTLVGGTPTFQFQRGDIDGNGVYGLGDAIAGLSFLFLGNPTPICQAAADFDDDDQIALGDIISLLNFLVSTGGPPAPPSLGSCGFDPTMGTVGCEVATTACP